MTEREDNVYMAKLSEQAERYDGMWMSAMFMLPLPCETARLCEYLLHPLFSHFGCFSSRCLLLIFSRLPLPFLCVFRDG